MKNRFYVRPCLVFKIYDSATQDFWHYFYMDITYEKYIDAFKECQRFNALNEKSFIMVSDNYSWLKKKR